MPEANSIRAAAYASLSDQAIIVSPLAALESVNAMLLCAFRRELPLSETRRAIEAFEAGVAAGDLHSTAMPASVWSGALTLSKEHSARLGTRSLDILHVAAARALHADTFLTFDPRQALRARAAGLRTPLPEA